MDGTPASQGFGVLSIAMNPSEDRIPMNIRDQMDAIYGKLSPEEIPWNLADPPDLLVELVASQWILPCQAVDLGCGAGNYAVWLATQGFQMTGIDISSRAVTLARDLAQQKGLPCRFVVGDLTVALTEAHDSFDFAFDWEVLHHIFPEDREQYARNVFRLLHPGGRYLSVCFSEKDPFAGGAEKYRETRLGTTLYFSSELEIHELFDPLFHIQQLCTVGIKGKFGPHLAIKALMTRRAGIPSIS